MSWRDAFTALAAISVTGVTTTYDLDDLPGGLRAADLPIGELLAAHIQKTSAAQKACGNTEWVNRASQELITLLRDDYATLGSVLGALADCEI